MDLEDLAARVADLENRVGMLDRRTNETDRVLMIHDEELDTGFRSPIWKRLMFAVDGWPLSRVVTRPAWRPWRRWWTS